MEGLIVIPMLITASVLGILFLFTPSLLARKRGHKNKSAIFFSNISLVVISLFVPIIIGLIGWSVLTTWSLVENV